MAQRYDTCWTGSMPFQFILFWALPLHDRNAFPLWSHLILSSHLIIVLSVILPAPGQAMLIFGEINSHFILFIKLSQRNLPTLMHYAIWVWSYKFFSLLLIRIHQLSMYFVSHLRYFSSSLSESVYACMTGYFMIDIMRCNLVILEAQRVQAI